MKLQDNIADKLILNKKIITKWINEQERKKDLPLYSSVDIRDAGFKMSVVDTNLFPAGFNNLCKLTLEEAKEDLKEVIHARVKNGSKILLISEDHTRNKWYLENIYVIENLLRETGFEVTTASMLPEEFHSQTSIPLTTAKDHTLIMYSLKQILENIANETSRYDMIILNNDLTSGIPESLKKANIPIYPSLKAGWHSRHKSHHFTVANDAIAELSEIINADPWHFSCLFEVVSEVDINHKNDREKLFTACKQLFSKIQEKYTQYNIQEKPFVFLKSDSGTYGMGVHPIESPEEILDLNRKLRNKLSKGKNSKKIERFIIQEGVQSINNVDQQVSEACVYQIANHFVGGFYRLNEKKTNRENLNSQGMTFRKMCKANDRGCLYAEENDCGIDTDPKIEAYKLLARIAGIAAHREILQLETQ
jgi:glutamate--cysteine ligase